MEDWEEIPCLGQTRGLSSAGRFEKDHETLPPMAALYLWCASGKCLIFLGGKGVPEQSSILNSGLWILRKTEVHLAYGKAADSSEPHRYSWEPIQRII